jgi:hypothetical protein
MLTLLYGAILAPGRRTVASALRAVGLEGAEDFASYHRVFNRARWSPMVMSRLLLGLLVGAFVPDEATLTLVVDETLERRRGRKIVYKGFFRDAVLSTADRLAKSWGVRWLVMCLIVKTPWTSRPWALPFLLVPTLSERRCRQLKRPYRSTADWTKLVLDRVQRWYPQRRLALVGDGAYAAIDLVASCQQHQQKPVLVARLRMDAVFYDPPTPKTAGKRGPTAKKGKRQAGLSERIADPKTPWKRAQLVGYGGQPISVEFTSGVGLWHKRRMDPVTVRFVLVRYSDRDDHKPIALVCSDPDATPEAIIVWYMQRWNIEVTFEQMRAHLGFETQRGWSKRTIGRTAPALFGVYSVVVLMACKLHPEKLPAQQAAWYTKDEPTFADALAAVRMHLWTHANYPHSHVQDDMCTIPRALLRSIQSALSYAA